MEKSCVTDMNKYRVSKVKADKDREGLAIRSLITEEG